MAKTTIVTVMDSGYIVFYSTRIYKATMVYNNNKKIIIISYVIKLYKLEIGTVCKQVEVRPAASW